MSNEIQTPSRMKLVRAILYGLVLTLGVIIVHKYFSNRSMSGVPGEYSNIPQEIQLKYRPADFKVDIDEENALAILRNPHRYRREFNDLVYDVNIALLNHVATRMGLPKSEFAIIQEAYEEHHPYLRNLYFQDFTALADTTSAMYESWYNNENTNAVEVLEEVASKYTCFLVNHVMSTLINTPEGSIYAKGKMVDTPCGIALTEGLRPLMNRMQESATIEDFSASKGMLQEKIERAVAELATMEVEEQKGLNKQLQTKVWGFAVSSTEIEISAVSRLKVGFKLNNYFNVSLDSKNKLVTVTLPEPTILSHEVYPKIDKLDIGWLRELGSVDLNKNFNVLRKEFRREALDSDIMDKSKTQAVELMNTMFGPMIASVNKRYKLRVRFRGNPSESAFDPEYSSNYSLDN